ncbi:hypothetical protein Ctob_002504 [Chrysochromulina tobinii]|uniref:Uncharacterized protein n=1 Tax=Chrysochromulina tobinii TaxID=1460289 RepID=A0A0M0JS78_9EUKA|nr:hypothetical protein Ctob_002504 [Chrysochromulina tobinii]|eukprot:KOO29167.1 hypothetical protein Ctob_002504 [Chrysochromulina sp. CCMP291]
MQVFDPLTNQNRPTQVPTSDLLHGPVVVTAEGSWGRSFSPFAVTFTYYELNRAINVTAIEPTAGSFYVDTLVTVRGNGFVDYSGGGGVYCSFPGPYWDPFMLPTNPEYPYQDFTSPATIVSTTEIRCVVPPKGNNSDPIFVEVCLSGHPDSSSVRGRQQHDHFCTASLNRFDYVDYADRFNLTLWNASVIAGPLRGGTELEIYGRFGFVDFLTLAPEFAGLPDGGQPRCVFGHGLGRKGGAPPDLALTSPATLFGATPLQYHLLTELGDNTSAVQSGLYELEYAPGGDVRATSRSTDQAVTYTYYDATFGGVTPRATPLQGGTRFLVRGNNLGQFGVGVQTGALNIYGQPSQVRAYFGYPRCFIGGHHRAVGATLEDCDPLVSGWTQAIGGTSGCQVLRCLAALPMAAVTLALPLLVSLNGQFDSAIFLVNVTYFDQDAVYISTVAPRAAPVTSDVPLRVHGAGFMDLGDMKCVLSTTWGANTPLAGMPRTIYVDANISADARTLICSPDETTRRSALTVNVGITLNGELATLKVAENLPIYFVDLGSIRLSTINPPAGPIRGGTTIVLMASSFTALQACAGAVCPEPPLCLIELRTPGSRPNGSALAYGAAAPARNVTVVGAEIAISPTGVVRYFLEVSLNGYADERTSSTVRLPPSFTW